jgi:murein DD-endopeptidase MepM/ murein hydrolase activator NlpD
LKFQIKTMEEPAATDSVTRLSTRVTPNSRPMYSVEDYPAPVAPKGYSRPAQDENENFKPLRFGERMLRNTAVCVAILLCALAIKTVDAPIARTVSSELRDWVTMDLDESLGSLKFVQNLLPDAALVFWHIGTQQTFSPPSQAALSHSWNENEPYLAYASSTQNPVYASAAGEVTAITYLDDSTITVRLRHEDGMETVYGNLASCTIREGDLVAISDVIGASDTLYFEIRDEGRSMNPAPLMAARQP